MASQYPPKKNAAYIWVFPIRGIDGLPLTGVAGLDSEVSKDGGAFADCTNEATEIGSTGWYSLTLTATEMNADYVVVQVKTTYYGYICAAFDTAGSLWDELDDLVDNLEARLGTPSDLGSGATVAANLVDIEGFADNLPGLETKVDTIDDFLDTEIAAIKAKTDNLPADPADASDVAAAVTTAQNNILAVLGALADAAADGDVTATDTLVAYVKQIVNTLVTTVGIPTFPASAAPGDGVSLAEAIRQIYDEVAGLNGGALLDAAGVRSAVGLAAANLDTQLSTIDDFLDTEVAAIKAKTDNLPADPADASDVASAISTAQSALETAITNAQAATIDGVLDAVRISKNTALSNFEFFMADELDHVTGKTGLTVTAERSIDGGAFAACTNAVTEVSAGVYKINLSAADLNGDTITLKFTATGADPRIIHVITQPKD